MSYHRETTDPERREAAVGVERAPVVGQEVHVRRRREELVDDLILFFEAGTSNLVKTDLIFTRRKFSAKNNCCIRQKRDKE